MFEALLGVGKIVLDAVLVFLSAALGLGLFLVACAFVVSVILIGWFLLGCVVASKQLESEKTEEEE